MARKREETATMSYQSLAACTKAIFYLLKKRLYHAKGESRVIINRITACVYFFHRKGCGLAP